MRACTNESDLWDGGGGGSDGGLGGPGSDGGLGSPGDIRRGDLERGDGGATLCACGLEVIQDRLSLRDQTRGRVRAVGAQDAVHARCESLVIGRCAHAGNGRASVNRVQDVATCGLALGRVLRRVHLAEEES